jgi:hypothetical protein
MSDSREGSVEAAPEKSAEQAAAVQAFRDMITELARFCVNHRIEATEVERTIRREFVRSARDKFAAEGLDASIARIGNVTGLPGFYVRDALEQLEARELRTPPPSIDEDDLLEKLMALVSTWSTEAPYVAFPGVPLSLRITGEEPTFTSLAAATVPDEQVDRLLKALVASGSVQLEEGGAVARLVSHVIFYKNQRARRIKRFGLTVSALMQTLTNNADRPRGKALLERTLITDRAIPDSGAEEFQDLMKARASHLLEALDAESRSFFVRGREGRRWGLCTFAFEVPGSQVTGQEPDDSVIDVLAEPMKKKR